MIRTSNLIGDNRIGNVDYGLLKTLWDQPNNILPAKLKLGYPNPAGTAVWATGTTWVTGQNCIWPSSSSCLAFRAKQAIAAGQGTPISRPDIWELSIVPEMVQDSGDGTNFFRSYLGLPNGDVIRTASFEYGTYTEENFELQQANLSPHPYAGAATSASISVPTSHPSSRTFTTYTGVPLTVGQNYMFRGASGVYFMANVTSGGAGDGSGLVVSSTSNYFTGSYTSWSVWLWQAPSSMATTIPVGTNDPFAWYNGEYLRGTITTYGGALTFRHIKAALARAWRFHYTGGPNIANPPADVVIDTYHASDVSVQTDVVWATLSPGIHTWTQTVENSPTCPDPNNVNCRAYFRYSSNTNSSMTYAERIYWDKFTAVQSVGLEGESFGEVAWRFRDNVDAGDTAMWFPDHQGYRTSYGLIADKIFTVDGAVRNTISVDNVLNPYIFKYQSFTNCQLVQTGVVKHPQEASNMGNYSLTHTFTNKGVDYDWAITWLRAALITSGYNDMVTMNETFFNKIKAQNSIYMNRPADGTSTNMASDFKNQASYLFYSTNVTAPRKDLVLGLWMRVSDWRAGLSLSGASFVQDFSAAAGAKFYPYAYQNYITAVNEITSARGRLYLGRVIDANANL